MEDGGKKESKAADVGEVARAPPRRANGSGYAFSGTVIRLTEADFENWRKSFSAIPDLRAELETIDAKLVDEGHEGKWFGKVSGWLKGRHEKLRKTNHHGVIPMHPGAGG